MDDWKPSFIDRKEIKARKEANTDALIKSMDSEDYLLKIFTFAKSSVERLLGIGLTNIELAGLRIITKKVLEEAELNKTMKDHWSMIDPNAEIPNRFIFRFYGITSTKELRKIFPPDIGKDGKEIWPTDYMYEYFKREQAKLHNEI